MIAHISFNTCYVETLRYCLRDKRLSREEREQRPDEEKRRTQNRAEVLYYHRCFGNHQEISRQFREVQKLNFNVRKPVLHVALSLPPGEKISKSQWALMAKDCAKALDFEQHQYVVILHKDTEHRHAHIVVNRIGFDEHTVVNQYMMRKVNQYCRSTELQYGLTPTKAMRWYRTLADRDLPSEHHRVVRLKVAAAVEAQPKPIVRRISFFPENDYQENYKTFIRWLIGRDRGCDDGTYGLCVGA